MASFAQDGLVDDGIFFDDRPRHDDGVRNFRPFFDGDAVEDDRIADGPEDFRTFGDEGTLGRALGTDEVRLSGFIFTRQEGETHAKIS